MDWLKVLSLAFQIINAVVSYLHDKSVIDGALAEALATHNANAQKDIADAQKARDAVRSAAASDPAGVLRDDDGFKRD